MTLISYEWNRLPRNAPPFLPWKLLKWDIPLGLWQVGAMFGFVLLVALGAYNMPIAACSILTVVVQGTGSVNCDPEAQLSMLLAIEDVCEELRPNIGIRGMLVNVQGAGMVLANVPLLYHRLQRTYFCSCVSRICGAAAAQRNHSLAACRRQRHLRGWGECPN